MKQLIKKTAIAVIVGLVTTIGSAQEIGIQTSGVFTSSLTNSLVSNTPTNNLGFTIGLSYRQYISSNWSIGIEPNYGQTAYSFKGFNSHGAYQAIDAEGEHFLFKYKAGRYKETIKVNSLNIPLTVQYETAGSSVRFFIKTGASIGLALKDAQSTTAFNDVQTSGFYSQYNVELTGPMFAGFGKFNTIKNDQNIALNTRWAWIFETGVKQYVSDRQSVYIGMYFDLGLNALNKKENTAKNHLEYNTASTSVLTATSILEQKQNSNYDFKSYSVGVKLQYTFDLKHK